MAAGVFFVIEPTDTKKIRSRADKVAAVIFLINLLLLLAFFMAGPIFLVWVTLGVIGATIGVGIGLVKTRQLQLTPSRLKSRLLRAGVIGSASAIALLGALFVQIKWISPMLVSEMPY